VHGTNQHNRSRQFGDSSNDRFTADTAERTGRSERSIQRDAECGEKISERALSMVAVVAEVVRVVAIGGDLAER
jgi:hypothetical protein